MPGKSVRFLYAPKWHTKLTRILTNKRAKWVNKTGSWATYGTYDTAWKIDTHAVNVVLIDIIIQPNKHCQTSGKLKHLFLLFMDNGVPGFSSVELTAFHLWTWLYLWQMAKPDVGLDRISAARPSGQLTDYKVLTSMGLWEQNTLYLYFVR